MNIKSALLALAFASLSVAFPPILVLKERGQIKLLARSLDCGLLIWHNYRTTFTRASANFSTPNWEYYLRLSRVHSSCLGHYGL